MKAVPENREGGARPGLRWARVFLAAVAVHFTAIIIAVVCVPIYATLAGGGSAGEFAGLISTWSLPVLTLPAAVWASRDARGEAALNGLLVGLLVVGILGLLFFWPDDPRSTALFALIVASGLAGALIGGRELPARD